MLRTVCHRPSVMPMPFYVSLSSLTLGNAGYIELFSFLEIGNSYHLTEFICFPFVVSEFRNMFFRGHSAFFKMSGQRLIYPVRFLIFKSDLNRIVTVLLEGLDPNEVAPSTVMS